MSHEGKMRRGEAYVNSKRTDLNESEQADKDYFLEQTKPKEEEPKKEGLKQKLKVGKKKND